MSKKLIIFAVAAEAAPTVHALNARPGKIPNLYEFDQGSIVVSGMGVHAAQMAVAIHAFETDEIWNLGIAGALGETLPIGELVEIGSIDKYIPYGTLDPQSFEMTQRVSPCLNISSNTGKLISSDFPIYDHTHRIPLSKSWDLVDMEGYGVAYATRALGKKCRMWKIVSDFASPGGRDMLLKHLPTLSERIAETIYETIHESSSHS